MSLARRRWRTCLSVKICAGRTWVHKTIFDISIMIPEYRISNINMRIIYFSLGYSTHDYRFLKSISDGGHDVFHVQLEGNARQVEDRLVPSNVQQVIWKGGH